MAQNELRNTEQESKKKKRLSVQLASLAVVLAAPFGLYWSLGSNLTVMGILFAFLFFAGLITGGWA